MKRHGPPFGSGPSADRKLRVADQRSPIRSDTWRARFSPHSSQSLPKPTVDDDRKTIALRAGNLHEVSNEAESALIVADIPFLRPYVVFDQGDQRVGSYGGYREALRARPSRGRA